MHDLKTPMSRLLRVFRGARDRWRAKALGRQKRLHAQHDQALPLLDVLESFGIIDSGNRSYYETHLARYQATLELIDLAGIDRPRVLELGGGGLAFALLIRAAWPSAEIQVGEYDGGVFARTRHVRQHGTGETVEFPADSFNIEVDTWPFADASFDLVLCMEILEHLLRNPCHAFREANRVLRPGGRLLVTTPNIASYEAVQRLVDLESPYLFGIYSMHGAYGRHNREYTPWEVGGLAQWCGFETEVLTTRDVYPPARDTTALREQLGVRLGPEHLRRQNTFYVGAKKAQPRSGYPANLFAHDPDLYRAAIDIRLRRNVWIWGRSLHAHVELANLGGCIWATAGADRVQLHVRLLKVTGCVVGPDLAVLDLPEPIAPGASLGLDVEIPLPVLLGDYRLHFDLVHAQVGWFDNQGSASAERLIRLARRREVIRHRLFGWLCG